MRWFCGHFIVSGHKITLIVDKYGNMTIVQSVKMTYIFKGIGEVDCEAVELTIAVEYYHATIRRLPNNSYI